MILYIRIDTTDFTLAYDGADPNYIPFDEILDVPTAKLPSMRDVEKLIFVGGEERKHSIFSFPRARANWFKRRGYLYDNYSNEYWIDLSRKDLPQFILDAYSLYIRFNREERLKKLLDDRKD